MSEPKNYTINAETGEFALTGNSVNLVVTKNDLYEAINSIDTASNSKASAKSFINKISINGTIKIIYLAQKAKELLLGDEVELYQIIWKAISLLIENK